MEHLTPKEILDGDCVVSHLGQAEIPSDKTLEEVSGLPSLVENCSGLVLPSEFLVGETDNSIGLCNLNTFNQGFASTEDTAEEIQMEFVDVSFPGKGSEVNRNEELVLEKTAIEGCPKESSASQLNEVDPARKIEVSSNGISLYVEVFGPPNEYIHRDEAVSRGNELRGMNADHVDQGNGALLFDNQGNPSAEVSGVCGSMLGVMQNCYADGEAKSENVAEEKAIYYEECKLSIGDLVWVRTKAQSWWPGLIFDPSCAPMDAAKSDKRACLLVKYFGNACYVWCSPLQLKPFVENFEHMSAQSDSTSFLGAVKKAVDEFGQRVKLQVTCPCFAKEYRTILTAQLAGNGGINDRTLTLKDSMGEIGDNSAAQFEPANFLSFVKYLAQDVSMPGMLELAATQNRLSAFYCAIGHHQLPMHQLRGTTDVKDGADDEVKHSGISADSLLKNKIPAQATIPREGITSSCGNEDVEVRNGSVEVVEAISNLPQTPTPTNKDVSTTANDGGSGGKSEKGYETRQRKRSKYLSPPYINLGLGRNIAEEGKGVSPEGQDVAAQSVESPPVVKCNSKKSQKKDSGKATSSHNNASRTPGVMNVSSANVLSEIRFAALDCIYPKKNRSFNSVEKFFSGFRRLVFRENSNHETEYVPGMVCNSMHLLQSFPGSEVPMDKAKGIVEAEAETSLGGSFAGLTDVSKMMTSHASSSVTSKHRRRKKEVATLGSHIKPTLSFSDANENPTNGSFIINFQETGCVAPDGMAVPKKREKAEKNLEFLLAKADVALPDLIGHNAKVGSFLKDVQVLGPCSTQNNAELSNREGMNGAASLYLNSELRANQPDSNGKSSVSISFAYAPQQMGLLCHSGKLEPKKRRRKEKAHVDHPKTIVTSSIPDLNGDAADPVSHANILPGINSSPPEGKPQRKRRRNKLVAGIPDVNFSYNKVETNGEASGTALLLKFAEGFPVPSKEALVATFCGFGPIKESETQALNGSSCAQVVFDNSSDARDAFRSFEKSSPFGPALVNYRLHYCSSASQVFDANTNLPMPDLPVTCQTSDGLKIPSRPCGLISQPAEATDLFVMRKNLEMMTSMLEKAGDNLSPETRAKLEGDVKSLLQKVSTMVGSASSS